MRRVAKTDFQRLLRFEFLEARIVFNADMFELKDLIALQQLDRCKDDDTLRFDQHGLAYYYDAVDEAIQNYGNIRTSASLVSFDSLPLDSPPLESPPSNGPPVPFYHSNPSYSKKIYLDFDGQMVSGSQWNLRTFGGLPATGATINAPVFSTDGDLANYNSSELATIQEVWARVAEDFAPFQVDVTTEDPGDEAFRAGQQAIRVMVSTNFDATSGLKWYPDAGGVAYTYSWNFSNTPVWVFYNNLGNGLPKFVAEAASHEIGHSLGLSHDGTNTQAYYSGHGSGQTGWAPIMGTGYGQSLTQWSKGEYTSANNSEEDLEIINVALAYSVDDHGDTPVTATQVAVGSGGAIASSGLIATRTDKDAFRFASQAGSVTINVDPFDFATGKGNLDVELSLVNSIGTTVATVNGTDIINASLTATLAKGYYTLLVDGTGKGNPLTDGYSDYASIGKYSLSGTVIPNRAPIGVSDGAIVQVGGSVLIDVLANDTDADLDTLSLQSVGNPSVGTAIIESGKVRFTPPTAFSGQATFSYVVVDEFGATAVGLVTINAASPGAFVNAVTINGGATQRSKLKTMTIEFDQQVVGFATAGAIIVEKRSDAVGGGPATVVPGVVVTASTLGATSTLRTLLTFTFTPLSTFVDATGSLVDGNYQVRINANLVTTLVGGFKLDGDKNGISGDDFVFGNKARDNFFRLFGDFDGGNAITGQSYVDSFDAGSFLGSYLKPLFYNSIFDFNEDGFVDSFDAGAFLGNYQKQRDLNGFTP